MKVYGLSQPLLVFIPTVLNILTIIAGGPRWNLLEHRSQFYTLNLKSMILVKFYKFKNTIFCSGPPPKLPSIFVVCSPEMLPYVVAAMT